MIDQWFIDYRLDCCQCCEVPLENCQQFLTLTIQMLEIVGNTLEMISNNWKRIHVRHDLEVCQCCLDRLFSNILKLPPLVLLPGRPFQNPRKSCQLQPSNWCLWLDQRQLLRGRRNESERFEQLFRSSLFQEDSSQSQAIDIWFSPLPTTWTWYHTRRPRD